MKMAAVIFASVAALAASTQAFLIWRDFEPEPSRIESERINNCNSLIFALSNIERDLIDIDEKVEKYAASIDNSLNLYSESMGESEKEAVKEETRRSAENFAIGNTVFELEKIESFVDVGRLYFSANESEEMGLDTFQDVIETVPSNAMSRFTGDYDFDGLVGKLRDVAARLSNVRNVCEPILLEE